MIQDIFIKSKIDKFCFKHDLANGDCIYLPRRTAADKGLRDKKFIITKNKEMDINMDLRH